MGEAGPGSLPFIWVGKGLVVRHPNLKDAWEQAAEDELGTEEVLSALPMQELAGGGAPRMPVQ